MIQKQQIEISYPDSDVWNKCLKQISDTQKIVSCLFHALDNYNHKEFIPLQMDGLPLIIGGSEGEEEELITKNEVLTWVYKKAFEEFIVGLTESLISAYKLLELIQLSAKTQQNPVHIDSVDSLIDNIGKKAGSLHFPALIDNIEKQLSKSLVLKKEILSINNIRNCLVHRNGIVIEKDFNNVDKLTLYYRDLAQYVETIDSIEKLTVEFKNSGKPVRSLIFQPISKEMSFELNAKVHFEANVFNGLVYTCSEFINDLSNTVQLIIKSNSHH